MAPTRLGLWDMVVGAWYVSRSGNKASMLSGGIKTRFVDFMIAKSLKEPICVIGFAVNMKDTILPKSTSTIAAKPTAPKSKNPSSAART